MKIKKNNKLHKILKITFIVVLSSLLFVLTLIVGMNIYVIHSTDKYIYDYYQPEIIPKADYILVLGCSVKPNGEPSRMLRERVERAVDLYNLGLAPKIIMSGDHSGDDYNEVLCMRNLAESLGVPSENIIEDPKGFSTYESCYRAKNFYSVETMIIVTHDYHLFRAVYDGIHQGITSYGVPCESNYDIIAQFNRDIREVVARCKDVVFSALKVEYK